MPKLRHPYTPLTRDKVHDGDVVRYHPITTREEYRPVRVDGEPYQLADGSWVCKANALDGGENTRVYPCIEALSAFTPMDKYMERVREAEQREKTGPYAAYRTGPASGSLPVMSCTMLKPPCGCDIDGDGNLQSPLRIKFCAAHAAAGVTLVKEA